MSYDEDTRCDLCGRFMKHHWTQTSDEPDSWQDYWTCQPKCMAEWKRQNKELERIEQSNDVAGIVADIGQKHGIFMYLDLRYDIADALFDAGYRQVKPDDTQPTISEDDRG